MPALCTSPTSADCVAPLSASASTQAAAPPPPNPIGQAFSQLVATLHQLLPATRPKAFAAAANDLGLRAGGSTARVRLAERYMAARLAGRNDEVLRLVSDDVELTSSRDGVVSGKPRFRDYIGRVKPTGTWRPATWNSAIGKAEVTGNVRILMVNVAVVARFGFDRKGKISRIYVGTRRKAPK